MDLFKSGFAGAGKPKELVTPHKVSLLVLINAYSEGDQEKVALEGGGVGGGEGKKWNIQTSREFAKCMLKWIQSSDVDLEVFVPKVQGIHADLANTLLTSWEKFISEGLSSMADVFVAAGKLLEASESEPVVHRNCIIGLFIRRMILAFDQLSFNTVCKLYKNLKKYCLQGKQLFIAEKTMATGLEHDLSLSGIFSHRQAEFFMSEQAALLQNEECKAMPPHKLQEHIDDLTKNNPELPATRYLSFLNYLRINEYCGAVHSLYNYFDRISSPNTMSNSSEEFSQSYRYAALNLASLHSRFGHKEEALLTLKEAIRMAQEANDPVCLQHALGWLYRLEGVDGPNSTLLLERAVTKSEELNLPYLTSLGVINFAQHKALHKLQPAKVMEYLSRSNAINCHHNQPQLMSVSLAQQASLWSLYGYSSLCSLHTQLLLGTNNYSSQSVSAFNLDSEAVCVSLCHQAILHLHDGLYQAALQILKFAESKFPESSQQSKLWMLCRLQVNFEMAMHKCEIAKAEEVLISMASLSQSEAMFRKVSLLTRKRETTKAYSLIYEIIENCKASREGFTAEVHAKTLLQLSQLYCSSNDFTSSLPHLLECIALSQENFFNHTEILAKIQLAQIQLYLKMPHHSIQVLDEKIAQVLAQGSLFERSSSLFFLAKCMVASISNTNLDKRKAALGTAVGLLNLAADGFTKLQAEYRIKDVMYLQAQMYHELGYTSERNKCAQRFRQLDQQFPTALIPPIAVQ
ncbi:anaphase-promoting complex subunit 5-like [Anneissia japonica]|uniref:anaphase-promoting complex subunit 5-like n=1 Tax=Anneissia japonica TaxID=1529436 RepID=UPI0014255D80|nr:anaphase-promoting complex subunit 5-like [Anneissia japonica]